MLVNIKLNCRKRKIPFKKKNWLHISSISPPNGLHLLAWKFSRNFLVFSGKIYIFRKGFFMESYQTFKKMAETGCFNTLFLTRFRIYKIATPTQTKT
jgi:hypothetical protein